MNLSDYWAGNTYAASVDGKDVYVYFSRIAGDEVDGYTVYHEGVPIGDIVAVDDVDYPYAYSRNGMTYACGTVEDALSVLLWLVFGPVIA